jgi:outer membrane protein OmpA-like peptidoglycan-associated protein
MAYRMLLLLFITGPLSSPAQKSFALAGTNDITASDIITQNATQDDTALSTKLTIIEDENHEYTVTSASFNSPGMDFSPFPYKNGIVFVSSGHSTHSTHSEAGHFLDLYFTEEAADGTFSTPRLLDKGNVTPYHLGPTVFFANDKQKIVTRNAFFKGGKVKDGSAITLELAYAAILPSGKWSELVPIQFRSTEYSVGHPAVSSDGRTLYFSSNMPGSKGGSDIFVSHFEDGVWSSPKNLGAKINTTGQELFPYLYNDTTLYFSSNGHPGFGGLDIFYLNLKDLKDVNQTIVHLKKPVNSAADDFGICLDAKGNSGFFSSNRSGEGNDDIFYFEEITRFVEVHLYDSITQAYVSDARVEIATDQRNTTTANTDLMGRTDFRLRLSKSYALTASHPDYKSFRIQLIPSEWPFNQQATLRLLLAPKKQLPSITSRQSSLQISDRGTVTNTITFTSGPADVDLVSDAVLPDSTTSIEKDSIMLPLLRVMAVENANSLPSLIIAKDGRVYEFDMANERQLENRMLRLNIDIPHGAKRYDYEKIIVDQITGHGYQTRFVLIRSFHFDSEKTLIRNDASAQLDKIIEIMMLYPQVDVQLTFHADSRGTEQFNLDLSRRRSEEVVKYLTRTGINKDRIQSTFVGESQLLNDCGDLADCDELQHQLNRTTEFKFIVRNQTVKE